MYTIEEIEDFEELRKMKNDAKKMYSIIIKYQKVGLADKYVIWSDEYNEEYLQRLDSGKWKWVAAYLHQHYEQILTEDAIFETMQNAYKKAKEVKGTCFRNEYEECLKYFTSYVNNLVKGE